jgi:phosphoserine phosphatase SerB
MNTDSPAEAPRWLGRSDALQPFVVTICSMGDFSDLLTRFDAELGDLQIREHRPLAQNACDVVIDCNPDEAWSLLQSLRQKLFDADVYMQPQDARGTRLLICDMDMTIVAAETLDEIATVLGMGEQIAAITTRAMHGEIDFNDALRERIAMLAGQPEQVFHDAVGQLRLNQGAEQLLAAARAAGVHTILISGGFAQVAEPVAQRLGFDEVHCNHLQVDAGKLTGKVHEPIVNADFKCRLLQQRALALELALSDCCAIW